MYVIPNLTIEVTRRCNLNCAHCMCGDAQNKDINYNDIEKFLLNPEIKTIKTILFTGGEPTLNIEIITKTIDLIIEKGLDVEGIGIVTNGYLKNIKTEELDKMIESLHEFRKYRNMKNFEKYSNKKYAESKKDKSVFLNISEDPYHKISILTLEKGRDILSNMSEEEINREYENYLSKAENFYKTKGLNPIRKKLTGLAKIGRSKEGQEKKYKLGPIMYFIDEDKDDLNYTKLGTYSIKMIDGLFLTAKGDVAIAKDRSFDDVDKNNYGSVGNFSITDILVNPNYGFNIGEGNIIERTKDYPYGAIEYNGQIVDIKPNGRNK